MAKAEVHAIGEVIGLLKDEFPDVTVSKVRFLESQGMISPKRSKSGYRQFSAEDIDRLRFILSQQRDHFLPLKVIKSKLTAWERGEEPSVPPASPQATERYFAATGVSMTATELQRAARLTKDQFAGLVEHGLLVPIELGDGKEAFQEESLVIAREAQRLLAYGLEPRHLRGLRLSAEREVELFGRLASPMLRHPNPDTKKRALELLAGCAAASRGLRDALLRQELRSLLDG